MGGSEVSGKNADLYKNKVIEVLGLNGYLLIKNSSNVQQTPDLIFKKPYTEGDTEIWVETKYSDVSLSDTDFLTELARYFLNYMLRPYDEKFDLFLFLRKCKNWERWRHVFDNILYKKEESYNTYSNMINKANLRDEEKDKIQSFYFFDFESFLSDCYVHQVNYDGLLMKILEYKTDYRKFTSELFYTRELRPLKSRSTIIANFAQISSLPKYVYLASMKSNVKYNDIFSRNIYYKSYWPKWGKVFSLYPFESAEDTILQYIEQHGHEKIDVNKWLNSNYQNYQVIGGLMKKQIIEKAVDSGCEYIEYKGHNLYFIHENLGGELQHIKDKQVSRCFKEAEPLFVKHIAIKINVKVHDGTFYMILSPAVLFSTDGKNLITGPNVRRLHEIFSPNRFDTNLNILGDLKWWFKFLNLGEQDSDPQSCRTSDLVSLSLPVRPPKNSLERDMQTTTQKLEELLDF